MDPKFAAVIETLHPSYLRLMAMEPISGGPPAERANGIYLFTENEQHLYVGRARDTRKRYDWHCAPASDHNRASFAFKLARKETGLVATYRKGEGRSSIILLPHFADAFVRAKARIRKMQFRYVSEPDPTRQALLEAYVCVVLNTPFNDFNTH